MVKSAEIRAAIMAALSTATAPIAAAELWKASKARVMTSRGLFDGQLSILSKNNLVNRIGERPPYQYTKVNGAMLPAVVPTERKAPVVHREKAPVYIKADLDHKTGRILLEFNGHVVFDFGKK